MEPEYFNAYKYILTMRYAQEREMADARSIAEDLKQRIDQGSSPSLAGSIRTYMPKEPWWLLD